MERRYSTYSVEELRKEIGKLKEQAQKAEQLGNVSEYEIIVRKMQMAAAYMVNPEDFKKGERYELLGDPGHTFEITYKKGVFAWGHRINLLDQKVEVEEAIPMSLLGQKVQP